MPLNLLLAPHSLCLSLSLTTSFTRQEQRKTESILITIPVSDLLAALPWVDCDQELAMQVAACGNALLGKAAFRSALWPLHMRVHDLLDQLFTARMTVDPD